MLKALIGLALVAGAWGIGEWEWDPTGQYRLVPSVKKIPTPIISEIPFWDTFNSWQPQYVVKPREVFPLVEPWTGIVKDTLHKEKSVEKDVLKAKEEKIDEERRCMGVADGCTRPVLLRIGERNPADLEFLCRTKGLGCIEWTFLRK